MTDARTGSALTPAEVARKLSKTGLLFLGESHTSAEFHRVQLQVIRELHRAGRKVLVGLEMFPVAEQPALDLWNGGTLSETEFVEKSRRYRNWGYHWNDYRDIFLFCRDAKIPLYGVNVPRELVSDVRKKGFDGLTAEQKALLPPKIDSETPTTGGSSRRSSRIRTRCTRPRCPRRCGTACSARSARGTPRWPGTRSPR